MFTQIRQRDAFENDSLHDEQGRSLRKCLGLKSKKNYSKCTTNTSWTHAPYLVEDVHHAYPSTEPMRKYHQCRRKLSKPARQLQWFKVTATSYRYRVEEPGVLAGQHQRCGSDGLYLMHREEGSKKTGVHEHSFVPTCSLLCNVSFDVAEQRGGRGRQDARTELIIEGTGGAPHPFLRGRRMCQARNTLATQALSLNKDRNISTIRFLRSHYPRQ